MELIRYIRNSTKSTQQSVATIGNFDGVHLGHQSVIRQLRYNADQLKLPAMVITFEPLPMEYFSPRVAPARLTNFREKIELLDQLSVDKVVCLKFGETLASLSAQAFVKEVLVDGLGIRRIIVGDDFRFGNNREGGVELLNELGPRYRFDVIPTVTHHYNGVRVSSSLVRGYLALGEFEEVRTLLGRSYRVTGKVIHGDKRGKSLGFPTANLAFDRVNCPLSGVYAVRVYGLDNVSYDGVANVGTRPVFNGDKVLLETYIFDFDQQIYGRRISVEFLKRLRDEMDFGSVEQLCAQIKKDAQKAKEYLEKL